MALPPNRGLPAALFEIDVNHLLRLGIEVPAPPQVTRYMDMPGGGTEAILRQPVPPEALRRVR